MSAFDLSGAVWRTSSLSGGNEDSCVEVAAVWRTSTYSAINEDSCVEVAAAPSVGLIAARDSKDRTGPVLTFGHPEWAAFLNRVKSGSYG